MYLKSLGVEAIRSISSPGSEILREYISKADVVLKEESSCWAAVPAAIRIGWWLAGDQATLTVRSNSFTFIFVYISGNHDQNYLRDISIYTIVMKYQ